MELGGSEIFANLLAKMVSVGGESEVFGWQDTEQPVDFRLEGFLTVDDED